MGANAGYMTPAPQHQRQQQQQQLHPNQSVVQTGESMEVPKGQQVAAKIVQPQQEPSWILASVIEYIAMTKKYRIKDDDPAEGAFAPEYLVPARNVVWLSEASNSITPKGGEV